MEYITYFKDTVYDKHLKHINSYLENIKNDATAQTCETYLFML